MVQIGRERGPAERKAIDKLASMPLSGWSPRAVSIATLGHRGLYEDFSVIWMIQLLGDSELKNFATPEKFYQTVIPVLRQKPKIEAAYLMGCMSFIFELKDPKYCEEISLLGLQVFPRSWRITMMQGYVFNSVIKDKAKAAVYFGIASTNEIAPQYVKNLTKKLLADPDTKFSDVENSLEAFREFPGGEKLVDSLKSQFKDVATSPNANSVEPTMPTDQDQNQDQHQEKTKKTIPAAEEEDQP